MPIVCGGELTSEPDMLPTPSFLRANAAICLRRGAMGRSSSGDSVPNMSRSLKGMPVGVSGGRYDRIVAINEGWSPIVACDCAASGMLDDEVVL